jgi:hypothetical protein
VKIDSKNEDDVLKAYFLPQLAEKKTKTYRWEISSRKNGVIKFLPLNNEVKTDSKARLCKTRCTRGEANKA